MTNETTGPHDRPAAELRLDLRYPTSAPERLQGALLELARAHGLSGSITHVRGALRATLQGQGERVSEVLTRWRAHLSKPGMLEVTPALPSPGLPPIAVMRGPDEREPASPTESEELVGEPRDISPLREIPGFRADTEPHDVESLLELGRSNVEAIAAAMGIDAGELRALADDLRGLEPEAVHAEVVARLGDRSRLDLEVFRKSSEKSSELRAINAAAPSREPTGKQEDRTPKEQPPPSLRESFGVRERTVLERLDPAAVEVLAALPPATLARHGAAPEPVARSIVAAFQLAMLDGIDSRLAASLAADGVQLDAIAKASPTDLSALVRRSQRSRYLTLAGFDARPVALQKWITQAKRLAPALELIQGLLDSVCLTLTVDVRFPWEAPKDARPLPEEARVSLVVQSGSKPITVAQSLCRRLNVDVDVDVTREVARRIGVDAVSRVDAYLDVPPSAVESSTDPPRPPGVIAETTPNSAGRVDFFLDAEALKRLPTDTTITVRIQYSGESEARRVTLDHRSITYALADLPHRRRGTTALLQTFVFKPIRLLWGTLSTGCGALPLDVATASGDFEQWPENGFTLFGTSWVPDASAPAHFADTLTYGMERSRIAELQADLDIGGTLLQSLHGALRPLYNQCAKGMMLSPANAVSGDTDIWAILGVVDPAGNWLANPTVTASYENVPSFGSGSFPKQISLEDHDLRSLGNAFVGLTLEDDVGPGLFRRINDLRRQLRVRRDEIQDLFTNRIPPDGDYSPLLAHSIPYTPLVHGLWLGKLEGDIWSGYHTVIHDAWYPFATHVGCLDELDRVIAILDQVSRVVDYHYLRQRVLTALKRIGEGHEYLGLEEKGQAVLAYHDASDILDGVIDDISNHIRTLPPPEGEYHLHRLMSVGDLFTPQDDMSAVFGRPAMLLVLAIFEQIFSDDDTIANLLARMTSEDVEPILDGDVLNKPLEDVIHYLRYFVVPACQGEVQLRYAEQQVGANRFDIGIWFLQQAAEYIPQGGADSTASHFLWLRIARGFLRKGYSEYAHGSWATARGILELVLADQYGPGGHVKVSETLLVEAGIEKHNPLVLALRIEACNHLANIDAGVNPLGFPPNYIPSVRWSWITGLAITSANQLNAAEQKYIDFRVRAEEAVARLNNLTAMTGIASAELAAAASERSTRLAELDAAHLSVGTVIDRLDRAREARDEWSRISTIKLIFNSVLNVAAGAMSYFNPTGAIGTTSTLVNTAFNDLFQLHQLERQVEDLEGALLVAQQNALVAQRAADSSQAYENLARLKVRISQRALAYEQSREFNYARWYALADQMQDIVRYRLRHTLRLTYLSQQAFYFMTSVQVPVVQFDIDPENTAVGLNNLANLQGHLMGDHAINALQQLDTEWINFYNTPDYQGQENGASLTETVRLDHAGSVIYTVDPLQFSEFRQNGGSIEFEIKLDQLDCRREGTYQRLIEDVEVLAVIGNLGSQVEVSGELSNSPYSIVRIHDPLDRVAVSQDEIIDDWVDYSTMLGSGFKTIIKRQNPQTRELSGMLQANTTATLSAPGTPILRPFEYNGMAQRWKLEIKPSENPTLDFSSFIELSVRFHYSLRMHAGLKVLHEAQCAARAVTGATLVVIWDNFFVVGAPPFTPDDRIAELPLLVDDFPVAHRDTPVLTKISCFFAPEAATNLPPLTFHFATDQYVDGGGDPIEVTVLTAPEALDGTSGQMAFSDVEDPTTSSPLDQLCDQDLTDGVVAPFVSLITGPANALVGATLRLRINLQDNPSLAFDDLDRVVLVLQYVVQ